MPEKERQREYNQRYYQKNKEMAKEKAVQYYYENAEAIKAHKREFHRENREKRNAYSREWRRKNPEKAKSYDTSEKKRARQAKYREKNKAKLMDNAKRKYHANIEKEHLYRKIVRDNLCDSYVRRRLTKRSILLPPDIPQSLVEAKRAHIKGIRLIKELENGETTTKDQKCQ